MSCASPWPLVADCYGRGRCLNGTQCLCDAGWSDEADWVVVSGCLVHEDALWWANLVFLLTTICGVAYSGHCLHLTRRAASEKLRTIGLLFTDNVCWLLYAALRVGKGRQDSRNGFDALTTFTYALGAVLFWITAAQFIGTFVRLAVKQARLKGAATKARMKMVLQNLRRAVGFVLFPLLFMDFVARNALVHLSSEDKTLRSALTRLLFVCYALEALFLLSALWHFGRLVLEDFDKVIRSCGKESEDGTRLSKIRRKIHLFRLGVCGSAVLAAGLLLGCGVSTLLLETSVFSTVLFLETIQLYFMVGVWLLLPSAKPHNPLDRGHRNVSAATIIPYGQPHFSDGRSLLVSTESDQGSLVSCDNAVENSGKTKSCSSSSSPAASGHHLSGDERG